MKEITLLGATGSIGTSTLQVLRLHQDEFHLHAAVARSSVEKMLTIAREFKPHRMAMFDKASAQKLRQLCLEEKLNCEILEGEEGVVEIAGDAEASQVIDAIVGAAGLKPVLAAVKTGCEIGLANKEALVMSGRLFFDEVKKYNAKVLPIDSEHSAIFQCLPGGLQRTLGFCDLKKYGVKNILLTGSGGPFRTTPLDELEHVTAAQALAHPVWTMGPKITIDSSTMMNKGLEFIEASYLFNAPGETIKILIHPQSFIHSMVAFKDGAIMAQLGQPDMRTPIARALGYPERLESGVNLLDFVQAGQFSFVAPDFNRYPCLKLAIAASKMGQGATTTINAANEVAVEAFLKAQIGYLDISRVCAEVLEKTKNDNIYTLEEIFYADSVARECARKVIGNF